MYLCYNAQNAFQDNKYHLLFYFLFFVDCMHTSHFYPNHHKKRANLRECETCLKGILAQIQNVSQPIIE